MYEKIRAKKHVAQSQAPSTPSVPSESSRYSYLSLEIHSRFSNNPETSDPIDDDSNESGARESTITPISCVCSEHLESTEVDAKLPLSAQKLFEKLFGPEASKFWNIYHAKVNNNSEYSEESLWRFTVDVKYGEWSKDTEAKKEVRYMIQVNNPMGKCFLLDCDKFEFSQ